MRYTELIKAYCTSMNKPKTGATNVRGRYATAKEVLGDSKCRPATKTINAWPVSLNNTEVVPVI